MVSIKAITSSVVAIVLFAFVANYHQQHQQTDYEEEQQEELTLKKSDTINTFTHEFKVVSQYLPHNVLQTLTRDAMKEIKCMALNNYYEAATEGIHGMRAVSQVVMNRIEETGFPSTACGVIYQKTSGTCQFSWVCSKSLPKLDTESKAWEDAVIAAKQTYVDGHSVHGLENALFYHATYVKPRWKKLVRVKKVGDHIFYKKREVRA